jgi:glycosyltransferase involved in cell wall biosynthesis
MILRCEREKVPMNLSIIIPSLNEGDSIQTMVSNILDTINLDNYEIIIVNSGGTEKSAIKDLPMIQIYDTPREGAPQARNFGATKASSKFLLFADAHLEFRQNWGPKIINDLENNQTSIIAPCITAMHVDNSRACGFRWKNIKMDIEWLPDTKDEIHEIPFACGCCMAVEKNTFVQIGQFDSGTRLWGEEDSEICIRAWLAGYSVLCDPSVRVGHKFRTDFPYEVEWIDINYNKIRFSFSHFNSERLARHLATISQTNDFTKTLLMVLKDNVLNRRMELDSKKIHDDDWFFEKFPMSGWSS